MKSEVKTPEKKNQKLDFPLLARLIDHAHNDVVLFIDGKHGFTVNSQTRLLGSGGNSDWVNCFDKKIWEILPKGSQVILTQE